MTSDKHSHDLLADRPTTDDMLDFESFATLLANRCASISSDSDAIVVGIYGSWGSGKSSLLKMVCKALTEKDISPVWFTAWKYEQENDLRSAFIQTILEQAKVSGRWYRRLWIKFRIWLSGIDIRFGSWELARKIVPAVLRLVIVAACVLIFLGWSNSEIKAALDGAMANVFGTTTQNPSYIHTHILKAIAAFVGLIAANPGALMQLFSTKLDIDYSQLSKKRTFRDRIAFLDQFTTEFQELVKLIGGGKPLVVVIDDLDRCLPSKTLEILEVIKLHLDVPGCVFLIAVDREVIEPAVASKYKEVLAMTAKSKEDLSPLETFRGENYLEKFIQLPFSLPPLSRPQIRRFVRELCVDLPDDGSTEVFAAGLPPNPRKIKRVIQSYLFVREMASAQLEANELRASLLAKLVMVQYRFRDVYKAIVATPQLLEAFEYYCLEGNELPEGVPHIKQALAYVNQYPGLTSIFSQQIDNSDSFIGLSSEAYVFLVKAVREVAPASQDDTMVSTAIAQILRHVHATAVPIENTFVVPRIGIDPEGVGEVTTGDALLAEGGSMIIAGVPGAGKTTLLKSIAMQAAQPENRLCPFFVDVRDYGLFVCSDRSRTGPAAFADYLSQTLAFADLSVSSDKVRGLLNNGKCVLLFDGFDELTSSFEATCRSIRSVLERYLGTRAFLSIRPPALLSLENHFSYPVKWLLPFSDQQVSEYIAKAVPDRDAEVTRSLRSNSTVLDLARRPLVLDLFTKSLTASNAPLRGAHLYSKLIDYQISANAIPEPDRGIKEDQLIRKTLAALAHAMTERGETSADVETLSEIIQSTGQLDDQATERLLDRIISRTSIVQCDHGFVSFVNRTNQSLLAGEELARRDDFIERFTERSDDLNWHEVLMFAAGIRGQRNPSSVLQALQGLVLRGSAEQIDLVRVCVLELDNDRLLADLAKTIDDVVSDESTSEDAREAAVSLGRQLRSQRGLQLSI